MDRSPPPARPLPSPVIVGILFAVCLCVVVTAGMSVGVGTTSVALSYGGE